METQTITPDAPVFTTDPLINVTEAAAGKIRELLAEEGKLKPLMDPHRFGLAQAQDAQVLQGSGKAVGKVVIDIE